MALNPIWSPKDYSHQIEDLKILSKILNISTANDICHSNTKKNVAFMLDGQRANFENQTHTHQTGAACLESEGRQKKRTRNIKISPPATLSVIVFI